MGSRHERGPDQVLSVDFLRIPGFSFPARRSREPTARKFGNVAPPQPVHVRVLALLSRGVRACRGCPVHGGGWSVGGPVRPARKQDTLYAIRLFTACLRGLSPVDDSCCPLGSDVGRRFAARDIKCESTLALCVRAGTRRLSRWPAGSVSGRPVRPSRKQDPCTLFALHSLSEGTAPC